MALISVAVVVNDDPMELQYTIREVFHPSYSVPVVLSLDSLPGVQKKAAENFKWGR
jgi:hypothetical protein